MNVQMLNKMSEAELRQALFKCCGSTKWVERMLKHRPFDSVESVKVLAEEVWYGLDKQDWLEAFSHHPKIGDVESLKKKFATTAAWAGQEQAGAASAPDSVLQELKMENEVYLQRYGYIFIVCATGKSAQEMLGMLKKRLHNSPEDEIKIAAQEQAKITLLRLEKL